MAKCSAPGCRNSYRRGSSLFRFPRDDDLREKWRAAVGKPEWSPNYDNRLCEAHFENSQWEVYCKRLKSGAVPTLFCNNYRESKHDNKTQHKIRRSWSKPSSSSDHTYALRCSVDPSEESLAKENESLKLHSYKLSSPLPLDHTYVSHRLARPSEESQTKVKKPLKQRIFELKKRLQRNDAIMESYS